MDFGNTLILIATIHALALVSPGPDFAIVTRLSIVSGRKSGLWTATGVAVAIGIYTLISLLGLSLVLAALPGLSRIIAIIGALYLAYIGIQCLRSNGTIPSSDLPAISKRKSFITGFFTNILNPKAMLYFGSILSQVVTPDQNILHLTTIWLLIFTESIIWFLLVAMLFSSKTVLGWLKNKLKWFERTIGVALLAIATKIGLSSL